MQIEFKVTVNSTEQNELLPYTNALERDMFLWELFHNFFRKWEHQEKDIKLEQLREDLFELKEKYKVIIN